MLTNTLVKSETIQSMKLISCVLFDYFTPIHMYEDGAETEDNYACILEILLEMLQILSCESVMFLENFCLYKMDAQFSITYLLIF